MTRCRAWRKRISEALYGELDMKTRDKMERHLAACPGCLDLYRGMARTIRAASERPAPDPGPEFWEGYWDRLERRMRAEGEVETAPSTAALPARRASGFPRWRWAVGAAAAAGLLAAGVFLGRTIFRPIPETLQASRAVSSEATPAGPAGTAAATGEPSLAVRTSRYLERSKVLLLAVVNYDSRAEGLDGLNLPLQRKASGELVKEAAGLRKELRASDRRLERLVADLEMILFQIANLSTESGASAIEVIKSGVESRDILFKIDMSKIRRPPGDAGPGRARSGAKTAA